MSDSSTPEFSDLDRFPATREGHVAFLGFELDKVWNAAATKQMQSENGCSDETIENMVCDIKWDEARERVSALSDSMPYVVVPGHANDFQEKLSVDTVEQINESVSTLRRSLYEVAELDQWLAIDGVKGDFNRYLVEAAFCGIPVDQRHQDIAFLLRQVIGRDPSDLMIREYLFRKHGILPSDPVDLVKLEDLLKHDAEQIRMRDSEAADSDVRVLIDRLLVGPDDVELTRRDFALLDAYMNNSELSRQKERRARAEGESDESRLWNKLQRIWNVNRSLQEADESPPESETDDAEADNTTVTTDASTSTRQVKRSTEKGEAREKLVAALTAHHKYWNGSCERTEYIGSNDFGATGRRCHVNRI